MSRWIDAAKNNKFQTVWNQLLNALNDVDINDSSPPSAIYEFARLRKILTLIDNVIKKSDPELFPVAIYEKLHQLTKTCFDQVTAYNGNKNAGNLTGANSSADSLFLLVRPYILVPDQEIDAFSSAVEAYSSSVTKYIKNFVHSAKEAQSALSIANDEAIAQKKRIDDIEARVKSFDDYIFSVNNENKSTEIRIRNMVEKITNDQKAVSDYYEKIFNGPESTSQIISGYERDIRKLRDKLNALTESATNEHEDLKNFYHRIFGRPDTGGVEAEHKGLKHELDERLEQLRTYEEAHNVRHNAMFQKVESLLPGATSAGLATAYKVLKDSFDKRISNYTKAFYGALVFLLISGLFMIIDYTSNPFKVELVKPHDWQEMLKTLLVRAPVVIPVVWFAVFSATRRSQYERLQQEYAHKEALASSYEGYKKQLQDLRVDAEELQKELIAKSINAIAYNASTTLDGKHTEKPPVLQFFEKLNADELKKLLEILRSK
ncbi:hypothetical protein [Comamonas sp. NoAH]|uniref:hypothetical protein n=1 Tax=Comamonas halotolerans TaxID=3041496 RepID=UPI0024E0A96E|nr:hypothetical protein [Comamonas sp. NoAH]